MSFNSPKSWKRILWNIRVLCSRLEKIEKRAWRVICDKIVFAEKLCGKERPSTKLAFRCSTQKTDYHLQVEWAPEFSSKKCISKRKPPDTLFQSAGWTYTKRFIETSRHTGIFWNVERADAAGSKAGDCFYLLAADHAWFCMKDSLEFWRVYTAISYNYRFFVYNKRKRL